MPEPDLRALERRAYARDSSPEERAAAEAELARIRAEQADAAALAAPNPAAAAVAHDAARPGSGETPEPLASPVAEPAFPAVDVPRFAVATRGVLVALGVAAAAAVLGAAYIEDARATSLEVFDRPLSAEDLAYIDETNRLETRSGYTAQPHTTRYLASHEGKDFFAYLMADNSICLYYHSEFSGGATCLPLDVFSRDGVSLGSTSSGTESWTAVWGPDGDLRYFDAPIGDVVG